MAEATAELAPDNAGLAAETQGEVAPQGAAAIAETDDAAQTTDSEGNETPASPFDGLDLEDIEKDPNVQKLLKDKLARVEESQRQRAEIEKLRALEAQQLQAYDATRQRVLQAGANWAATQLQAAVEKAIDSGEKVDARFVSYLSEQMGMGGIVQANEAFGDVANSWLAERHPQYAVPPALARRFMVAQANFNPMEQFRTLVDVMEDAVAKSAYAKGKQDALAELQKEDSSRADVEKEKAAAKARANQPKPTSLNGAQSPGSTNYRAILESPTSTQAQRKDAWKALYGFDYPG